MENVTIFLKGCRALGISDFELFSTADLTEEKNIKSVANCIHALGRLMQSSKFAHMNFPILGKKAAEKNVSGKGDCCNFVAHRRRVLRVYKSNSLTAYIYTGHISMLF